MDESFLERVNDSDIKALKQTDPELSSHIHELQSDGYIFALSVRFKGSELLTRETLHHAFATKLQFPDFYGENWSAWIDVMDDMIWNPWPMAKVVPFQGGLPFRIIVEDSKAFRESGMYTELFDCIKFINEERRKGEAYVLVLE
jgi:Barstar (barnase inhibitor)